MDKQTNTPKDWRLLAERDLSVADYLAGNMRPVPAEIIGFLCQQVLNHTKTIRDFFQKEIPGLFR